MEAIVRPDIRRVDDNVHQSAKDILIEKGILRDPTKPTVLLDQFTGTRPTQQPELKTAQIAQTHTIDTQTDIQGTQLSKQLIGTMLNDDDKFSESDIPHGSSSVVGGDRKLQFGLDRQFSHYTEVGVAGDLFGLLAEMNKKID